MLGKSRVAPLKQMTILQMELTAAVVAVNIDKTIKKELELDLEDSTFWTDSTTVQKYIESDTLRFKTFVANKVFTIRDLTHSSQWKYVNTSENPADCAPRGLTAVKLMNHQSWIHGPSFLQEPEIPRPNIPGQEHLGEEDPEIRKPASVSVYIVQAIESTNTFNKLITHYSSWYKLKKAVAWMLKFKALLKQLCLKQKEATANVCSSKTENAQNSCKRTSNKTTITVEDP